MWLDLEKAENVTDAPLKKEVVSCNQKFKKCFKNGRIYKWANEHCSSVLRQVAVGQAGNKRACTRLCFRKWIVHVKLCNNRKLMHLEIQNLSVLRF